MQYRHRQFGRPAVVSGIAMTAILTVLFFYAGRGQPLLMAIFAAALALEIVVHYLLSSLTVEVSADELSWHFGPCFWRRRVARSAIARVVGVRLPWWYGVGNESEVPDFRYPGT